MEQLGSLAQLVEQRTFNPLVTGSNPVRPTSNATGSHYRSQRDRGRRRDGWPPRTARGASRATMPVLNGMIGFDTAPDPTAASCSGEMHERASPCLVIQLPYPCCCTGHHHGCWSRNDSRCDRKLHPVPLYRLRRLCPVDCFREGPNFLAIDPDECIDCAVCVAECPVNRSMLKKMSLVTSGISSH